MSLSCLGLHLLAMQIQSVLHPLGLSKFLHLACSDLHPLSVHCVTRGIYVIRFLEFFIRYLLIYFPMQVWNSKLNFFLVGMDLQDFRWIRVGADTIVRGF